MSSKRNLYPIQAWSAKPIPYLRPQRPSLKTDTLFLTKGQLKAIPCWAIHAYIAPDTGVPTPPPPCWDRQEQ